MRERLLPEGGAPRDEAPVRIVRHDVARYDEKGRLSVGREKRQCLYDAAAGLERLIDRIAFDAPVNAHAPGGSVSESGAQKPPAVRRVDHDVAHARLAQGDDLAHGHRGAPDRNEGLRNRAGERLQTRSRARSKNQGAHDNAQKVYPTRSCVSSTRSRRCFRGESSR